MIDRIPAERTFLAAVLLLALAARVAAVMVWHDDLAEDRDGYLGIARNVAAGAGFIHPGTDEPTAYRPPLYPLVLAPIVRLGGGTAAIAVLHVVLGTGTVYFTYRLGKKLGWNRGAFVAGGLVAVDPILLRYTAYAMTETLFTFLVAGLLVVMCGPQGETASGKRSLCVGVLFGLCTLCRPTIWAFGGLLGVAWLWRRIRNHKDEGSIPSLRGAILASLGVAVVVAPWVIRNVTVFDKPIVTTTHGGYTLLLGNNPVFYEEVVHQPWGTVWNGESLDRWQKQLDDEMHAADPPVTGEGARDRWHYERAIANIRSEPVDFLRACGLQFLRFWNVAPLNADGSQRSPMVPWGVGLFYTAILVGFAVSLWTMRRSFNTGWLTLLLLIVAFSGVHLLYWTNARMRAPVIPAIAVIAVVCLDRRSAIKPESSRS